MKTTRKTDFITAVFLLFEAILYGIIHAASGTAVVVAMFSSIVLCFVYALTRGVKRAPFIVGALACTVCADFFLVVCEPIEQLWGMVFFLGAQTLYAIHLYRADRGRVLLFVRVGLVVAAVVVAFVVLREQTDALALVSMAYYANLIANILVSARRLKTVPLMFVGFVLFILCDTVIGLQVAADAYLPISEGTWLHNMLFTGLNLAWVFYLPSQVCLALSSHTADD